MDIITHTLSGAAAGLAIAGYARRPLWQKTAVAGMGALGGFLPDVDAISRWPGFDNEIGARIGLAVSGEDIYFGDYWYSHRGLTHSLFFSILTGVILLGLLTLTARFMKKQRPDLIPDGSALYGLPYAMAVSSGIFMHILGDLPTPPGEWGGIRILWPFAGRSGGWGMVWWWNNYDILLIAAATVGLLAILVTVGAFWHKRILKHVCAGVFALGLILAEHQVSARPFGFGPGAATDWQSFESRSEDVQIGILGEGIYDTMLGLDQSVHKVGLVI